MMDDFRTLPTGAWQQTLIVQKSRFVAFAKRVSSSTEAQAFIKAVALPDATHHCYAYVTFDGQKSNDNGEPAGTAGLPILQAIKAAQLINVVVVVERYFGGIKLGTGGLARAYGQAANQVLSGVTPVVMRDCAVLSFETAYEQQTAVNKLIQNYGKIMETKYEKIIQWHVAMPAVRQNDFVNELTKVLRMTPNIVVINPHSWVEFLI